jgi:aldose 1-epimerase
VPAGVKQIEDFGITPDGKPIHRWHMDNGHGVVAEVLNLGGIVTKLCVPDRTGKSENITLAPADVPTIYRKDWPYLGAIIGRVGNRIRGGTFSLDGQSYQLPINAGPNSLHGGMIGYDRRIWDITPLNVSDGVAIKLSLIDPDGTENYPGTVKVDVVYTLTANGIWRIDYTATTDRATPINLTQHAYFNLKDAGRSPITGHVLQIPSTQYTPTDADHIVTGEILPVDGTPYDFTTPKPIGRDFPQLTSEPLGYDCNYIVPGQSGTLRLHASVTEPTTGRTMDVYSTEPAIQLYTGDFLDGTIMSPDGFAYQQHAAFCLETQHYPDSPNHPEFPSTTLRPGKTYRQTTEYRFSAK